MLLRAPEECAIELNREPERYAMTILAMKQVWSPCRRP